MTLMSHGAESERPDDRSSRDERKRQVRLWPVLLEECAVDRRFRREVIQARVPEGLSLEDATKGVWQGLLRNKWGQRVASLDDPLMRVLQKPAVGGPLKQRAAIDGEELDKRSQRGRDLGIHVRGGDADESGGDFREKPLKGA